MKTAIKSLLIIPTYNYLIGATYALPATQWAVADADASADEGGHF